MYSCISYTSFLTPETETESEPLFPKPLPRQNPSPPPFPPLPSPCRREPRSRTRGITCSHPPPRRLLHLPVNGFPSLSSPSLLLLFLFFLSPQQPPLATCTHPLPCCLPLPPLTRHKGGHWGGNSTFKGSRNGASRAWESREWRINAGTLPVPFGNGRPSRPAAATCPFVPAEATGCSCQGGGGACVYPGVFTQRACMNYYFILWRSLL